MMEWWERWIETVGGLDPAWAYALLGISAFLENVVPPVPGDTVVAFSAYLIGRGVLRFWPVYLSTCLGGTTGFMVMYEVGRRGGRALIRRLGIIWVTAGNLDRAERWLARRGVWLVLANRFLSGVRSVIAVSAGIVGMERRTVLACAAVSMALWNGVLLYAGYLLGDNWEQLTGFVRRYNAILAVVLAVAAATTAGWWWRRRKGKRDLTVR